MDIEPISDQPPSQPDPLPIQKQHIEDATDFLSICDGTGHLELVDGL